MNNEEIRSTIEQIKAQLKAQPENKDKSEDEIDQLLLDAFYKKYTEGEMTKEDLGGLAEMMGYEFSEEFDQDPNAANEVNPGEAQEPEGEPAPAPEAEPEGKPEGKGATEEDLEAVRTMEPGESAEEFEDKVEDVKEGEHVEEEGTEEGEAEEGDDDETAERKEASKLWKMNLNK